MNLIELLLESLSKKKAISNQQAAKIFTHPTLRIHFVEENKIPQDYNPTSISSITDQMSGKYETGKFHMILRLTAPERLTGISQNDNDIFQEWELLKCIKSNKNPLDGIYEFKAWGRTPCIANDFSNNQHHEGKKLYIDREFMETKIISAMYLNDNIPDDKLINTIGFEYVNFG